MGEHIHFPLEGGASIQVGWIDADPLPEDLAGQKYKNRGHWADKVFLEGMSANWSTAWLVRIPYGNGQITIPVYYGETYVWAEDRKDTVKAREFGIATSTGTGVSYITSVRTGNLKDDLLNWIESGGVLTPFALECWLVEAAKDKYIERIPIREPIFWYGGGGGSSRNW